MKVVLWTVAVLALLLAFGLAALASPATASVWGTVGGLIAVVAWGQLQAFDLRERRRR